MKRTFLFTLCLLSLSVAAVAASSNPAGVTPDEVRREAELRNRLCADKSLDCSYVTALFSDERLTIYHPPEPTPAPTTSAPAPRERERNPYLTKRFGLLVPESLERCRNYIEAHALAFDAAYRIYGVPKEVICGHLRIETDFGIPTHLSPHPEGSIPAIDRLVTLYVRRAKRKQTAENFARRQTFALEQLKDLVRAATANGWDLFQIPGSSTGAIGLVQFEPSSFAIAVDGDGDGKIDLFDPEDAILSIAHYLVTRGWDTQLQHQQRAVYAYYGGHYDSDPNKFYMKAVLKYANEMADYLKDHPVTAVQASLPQLHPSDDASQLPLVQPSVN